MQCTKCEYALWNLKARQCPECGEPFLPSQYEFVLNSVRFCCPHCNQGYYGTGMSGHLVPNEFDCVKCGEHITMDEMVLLPAEGVTERQTRVETAPWLDRQRIGRIKAWFSMIWLGMFAPHRLIRGVPSSSPSGQAWLYSFVTSGVFSSCCVLPFLALVLVVMVGFSGSSGASGISSFTVASVGFWFGMWFGVLVLLCVWMLLAHGILLITGKTKWPMSRTFHALSYSMGGAVLLAFPLLGIYPFGFVPLLWWMVSAIVMLTIAQEVRPWRSILAAGSLPVLIIVLLVGGFMSLMLLGMSQVNMQSLQAAASATVSAQTMNNELMTYAAAHNGEFPPFALEMTDGDVAKLPTFVAPMTSTWTDDVPIGDTTLEDMMLMPSGRLREKFAAIGAALPDDVVAYRIGDFVFTYHGITTPAQDGGLWTIVLAPPGVFVIGPNAPEVMKVVRADGVIDSFTRESFVPALEAQNALRAAHSLPPLPDPNLIMLDQPVVRANGLREQYANGEKP